MNPLITESGKTLREGDVVTILRGPRAGQIGKVIGFSLVDHPVVVQYKQPIDGWIRENHTAKDLGLSTLFTNLQILDPIGNLSAIAEGIVLEGNYRTCGRMLSFNMKSGETLTFVPIRNGVKLRSLLGECKDVTQCVRVLASHAFVTRLPHLVGMDLISS